MSDDLPDLFQDDLVARLSSNEFFSDIVIIQERLGEADTEVKKALAGELPKAAKFGAFLILEMPTLKPDPEIPGPQYHLTALIHSRTIPKYNNGAKGTAKKAGRIAQRVDQLLHLFQNNQQCWQVVETQPFSENGGVVGYTHHVNALAEAGELPSVAQPSSSNSGLTVTLACGTSGAAIWSTTDGSFPWPENPTATLYTAPFEVTNGATVRYAAYKTGLVGSHSFSRTVRVATGGGLVDSAGTNLTDSAGTSLTSDS